ncbi:hypothetical protein J8629_15405 [Serratia fonticola]|nr:hypothetical protein [Serratia fonticola]
MGGVYDGDSKRQELASDATIRDHFAGMAMQGIIANQLMIDDTTDSAVEWAAKGAYKMADAMLKYRGV